MCHTFNFHWGIAERDFNYLSPAHVIESLCSCRGAGANLLMNVGPTAEGAVKAGTLRKTSEQVPFAVRYLKQRYPSKARLTILLQFSDNEQRVRERIRPAMMGFLPNFSANALFNGTVSGLDWLSRAATGLQLGLVPERAFHVEQERWARRRDANDAKNRREAAEAARGELNRLAARYLNDTNPDTANATMFELMTNALKFFKMMGASSEERQRFIQFLATEHEASRERFRQMVSVAFDEGGLRDLEVKLADLGFGNSRIGVVRTNNDILAWELCTEKQLPH